MSYKSFIGIGDTHGNFKLISHRIKALKITDMSLFHTGDFGVGFDSEKIDTDNLNKLNDVLVKFNCQLYVCRGNHDDPAWFVDDEKFSNIHLMPDYSVVNVNGDNVLMVGGAISIDRKMRLADIQQAASVGRQLKSYWFDEVFVLDEEKLEKMRDIKYVITHTIHKHVGPYIKQSNFVMAMLNEGDDALLKDLEEEREHLTKMYDILKNNNNISTWLYGHFHDFQKVDYENTDFIMLKIDQFYEVRQN